MIDASSPILDFYPTGITIAQDFSFLHQHHQSIPKLLQVINLKISLQILSLIIMGNVFPGRYLLFLDSSLNFELI
jgi:hypothetical protein